MRNLYYALITLVGFALFSCGPTYVVQNPNPAPPPQAPPATEATYQNFYDALSPYGEWINNPEYGYVWMPNAGPDFKPYATNGNWVYTDEGWAWNSDYAWGWAPFHYGRWFYEDGYGWMWIPGNEWAPAWVTWRRSPDYYGWAPLGPSVSLTVAVNGGYNPPPHYWCFVPHQYVTSQHVNNYYVNEQQNTTIINNTTVIHNTTVVNNTYNNTVVNNNVNNNVNNTRVTVNNYAGGPDPGEVSRVTGNQIHPVAVRESNAPGANRAEGTYSIFRPRINPAPQGNNGNNGNGGSAFRPAPAPTRVQNLNNVRPVNTTIYSNNRGPINNNNNTNINNTTVNNNTANTNITNNNNTNNTYNNFRPNPNPNNPAQQGNPNQFRPNGQPGNPNEFRPNGQQPNGQQGNPNEFRPIGQQPNGQQGNPNQFRPNGQQGNPNEFRPIGQQPNGQQPNNTRFIPGSTTNNGNPAVTPTTTGAAGNTFQPQPNNRLPGTGTDNGNGNGYRNNGNGNGNGNGLRVNGNGNNSNGNNGNGRGNAGNGNVRPAQPGTTGVPGRPFPKPKDTTRRPNPNGRP